MMTWLSFYLLGWSAKSIFDSFRSDGDSEIVHIIRCCSKSGWKSLRVCGESAHYLALVCVNVGNKVNENDGELKLGMTRFRIIL